MTQPTAAVNWWLLISNPANHSDILPASSAGLGLRQPAAPSPIDRDAVVIRRVLDRDLATQTGRGGVEVGGGAALIALCGLPGTGKSYFAGELLKRLDLVVLETDRLRKALVTKPKYTPGEHSRVFSVCHLLIEEYLTLGYRVLFDATNLTEQARTPLYRIADRLSCPLFLVGLTAPGHLVRQRLDRRAAGQNQGDYSDATWRIHRRMAPFEEPIARPHVMVDSSRDIKPSVDRVLYLVCSRGSASAVRDVPS